MRFQGTARRPGWVRRHAAWSTVTTHLGFQKDWRCRKDSSTPWSALPTRSVRWRWIRVGQNLPWGIFGLAPVFYLISSRLVLASIFCAFGLRDDMFTGGAEVNVQPVGQNTGILPTRDPKPFQVIGYLQPKWKYISKRIRRICKKGKYWNCEIGSSSRNASKIFPAINLW